MVLETAKEAMVIKEEIKDMAKGAIKDMGKEVIKDLTKDQKEIKDLIRMDQKEVIKDLITKA